MAKKGLRATKEDGEMPTKKWEVVEWPGQWKVIRDISRPPKESEDLNYPLLVREAGKPKAEPFRLEVEVKELWINTARVTRGEKTKWEGFLLFQGQTLGWPRNASNLTAVRVTHKVGAKENPQLEVISMEK